jgi:hypothetical protein
MSLRILRWTSWASSGVATLPVPMAQTGSYAMHAAHLVARDVGQAGADLALVDRVGVPRLALLKGLAHAQDALRARRRAPPHLEVDQLVLLADDVAALGVPAEHVVAPQSLSMATETSPVYAPSGRWYASCAPSLIDEPRSRRIARTPEVGERREDRDLDTLDSRQAVHHARVRSAAVVRLVFIFQLPPTKGLRSCTGSPICSSPERTRA